MVGVTVVVPLTASLPVQAPLAVHDVALLDDQVRLALWPTVIEVGVTVIVTVGAGVVTVRVAVAFAEPPLPVQVNTKLTEPLALGVTLCVPLTASLPVQPFVAVQALALVEDQVRVALLPRTMLVGATLIVTVGAGGAVTVTLAAVDVEAVLAASPLYTAVTEWAPTERALVL